LKPPAEPFRRRLARRALRLLARTAPSRWYGPLAGAIAFTLTLTASAPYVAVLIAALWLTPERWRTLVLWSSIGGAAGAVVLMNSLRHLGWAALHARFPELAGSPAWLYATDAIQTHGIAVLGLIAAAPMPQTPGLALAAAVELDPLASFLALFAGKVIKYATVAWLVSIGSPIANRLAHGLRPRARP
jgi:membrane protein YqaA with SNARE-associated domain